MATDVFLVTSGCYSGYGIEAVFSTLDLAIAYIGVRTGDIRIEPMVLDEPDAFPSVEQPWHVQMYLDGSRDGMVVDPYADDIDPHRSRDVEARILSWPNREREVLSVTCWARDETHAVKITNEVRTAYNAGAKALPYSRYTPDKHPRPWVTTPA